MLIIGSEHVYELRVATGGLEEKTRQAIQDTTTPLYIPTRYY